MEATSLAVAVTKLDGSSIWFDYVDTPTWSPLMVENLLEDIGYEMHGKVNAHYVIPVLTLARNDLGQIRDDHYTMKMVNFVDIGHHFISIYLNHDESIGATNWDDVKRR
jgi:hypothetical protein